MTIKTALARLFNLFKPAAPTAIVVGTDLVWIPEVEESVQRHGKRYLDRIFTAHELASCQGSHDTLRMDSLAARFAAKEAVMKVLRPLPDQVLLWSSIEVIRDVRGATAISLQGNAKQMAADAGIAQWSVSLSHDCEYATATVVALSQT